MDSNLKFLIKLLTLLQVITIQFRFSGAFNYVVQFLSCQKKVVVNTLTRPFTGLISVKRNFL